MRKVNPPMSGCGKPFSSLKAQKAGLCGLALISAGILSGCICLLETYRLKHHQITTMSNHLSIPLNILLPTLAKTR